MKKTISIILVIALVMIGTNSIFAESSTDGRTEGLTGYQLEELNSIEAILDYIYESDVDINTEAFRDALLEREWSLYENDEEFARHYEEDPESAKEMIERNVDNQLQYIKEETEGNRQGNATNAWVTPLLVQQKNGDYCGPCSALQAIGIYGGYVAGTTNNAKQDTLAAAMGTNSSGTIVYNLTTVLNTYIPGYSYKLGSNMTTASFKQVILNSLVNEKAPILHARTQYLTYYNGHASGHYICVTAFNNITSKIRLSDCNNDDDYYGTRSNPTSEAKAAVSASNRYLISANMT